MVMGNFLGSWLLYLLTFFKRTFEHFFLFKIFQAHVKIFQDSAISPRIPSSLEWRMVFGKQDLSARCVLPLVMFGKVGVLLKALEF